jgi:hypothetical protein
VTYLAAAEAILKATKRPMTAVEITEEAIKQHLLPSTGKTPVATMRAAIYTARKDQLLASSIRPEYVRGPRSAVRWVWYAG